MDFDVKLILILKIVRARVQGAVAVSSGWLSRFGGLDVIGRIVPDPPNILVYHDLLHRLSRSTDLEIL